MRRIIATDSCHRQQLIRATHPDIVQPMVANTKQDFADRLAKACDDSTPPIQAGRGRRAELRRRVQQAGLDVSGESVRKWLSAESIPSMDNIRFIAIALGVDSDWLLTGRKQPPVYAALHSSSSHPVMEPQASETYGKRRLSKQAMAVAAYYDKLPIDKKAEIEHAMVAICLSIPEEKRAELAEILTLFH